MKNNQGLTAFDLVLQSGDATIIEWLTKKIIYTLVRTDSYSSEYEKHKEFLLKHFGIDRSTQDGTTLLIEAVSQRSYDKCVMLLKNGANINKANTKGMTPLFMALTNSKLNHSVPLLLLEYNATVTEILTNWNFVPQYVYKKIIEKYNQQTNSKK